MNRGRRVRQAQRRAAQAHKGCCLRQAPVEADPDGASAEPASTEAGSAVVDFVLVAVLLSVLALALLQLGLALHVRNTLTWAASEGARAGARVGATPGDGAQRCRELIGASLSPSYAGDVQASRRVEGGVAIVEVAVRAPLPVVGLWGPAEAVSTRGRAFAEDQS